MKDFEEEYPESLIRFESDIKEVMKKNSIREEHAACYICNFEDAYICKEYNGGCKSYDVCEQIRK